MANKKTLLSAAAVAATMTAQTATEITDETAGKLTLSAHAKQLFNSVPFDAADRGKAFRKTILTTLMAEHPGTSIASAAGAYNQAKKAAQTADPVKWAALGREEGKNNGGPRKSSAPVTETQGEAETATA